MLRETENDGETACKKETSSTYSIVELRVALQRTDIITD